MWRAALIILGGALLLLAPTAKPLGLRNNNPGNLRPNPNFTWRGQIGSNKGFVVFDNILNGIRAAYINLRSYFKQDFNTVDKIINRWAPDFENETKQYILFVSRETGFEPNEMINFNPANAEKILGAIFKFENGETISPQQIKQGISLA